MPVLGVEFINWMSLEEYECVKVINGSSTQGYVVLDLFVAYGPVKFG